jgi:hypothetical protein
MNQRAKRLTSLVLALVLALALLPAGALALNLGGGYSYITDRNGNATIKSYSGKDTSIVIPSALDGHPVTAIGKSAFQNCSTLVSVVIPGSIKTVGEYAFGYCKNLQEVIMREGVTTIGMSAFDNCTRLKEVTIPKSVTMIDNYAFYCCDSLMTVFYSGSKSDWTRITIMKRNDQLNYVTKVFNTGEPVEIEKLAADKTSGTAGYPITWKAEASGGRGELSYRFFIYLGSTIVFSERTYKSDPTLRYFPTEAGSYRARVFVKDSRGEEANMMSKALKVAPASGPPSAIESVIAKAEPGKNVVTWSVSKGAAAYIIQRRIKGDTVWKTLKSNVTDLWYEDTTGEAGVIYQYRVRGRCGTVYGPFKVSSVVRTQAKTVY